VGSNQLPARGERAHALGLPLPPDRMPAWRAGRPLKRWRYVGVYGPELMLCVGEARIGPLAQRFWAVAEPGRALLERTTLGRGGVSLDGSTVRVETGAVRIELTIEEGEGVEVVSPSGVRGYVWTRKQAGVRASGSVELEGRRLDVEAEAVIDDTAGYHERHTSWRWSAGVGRTEDGQRVGWNLVSGIADGPVASERTVWVDGIPREVGPVEFAPDLCTISSADGSALSLTEWSARKNRTNMLVLRSYYRQPFGTFSGQLPGGIALANGFGVTEEHDVRW
jgi:uncharacterized protein DUF2804